MACCGLSKSDCERDGSLEAVGPVREAHSSAAGIREERRDSQQSGLPCSVWAEERDKFAGEDFERDIAESGKGTETLLDGLERKA